ncbi:MAG: hypothetical protein IPP15_16570 [Saprospiraceae bacterium]|uniref:Contractile injection system tube protein N-terminal domain-containing protein n=1 Tax=Candidatus Opimibacter skivensis TaxID=2982028 RepID=A0A9D7SXG0_9BACT|nr:hypothetical protein [Candidatus Opimibacter skivensis]
MAGKLEKLGIYAFKIKDFSDTGLGEPTFTLPINPESFTKNYKVEHDQQRSSGNSGQKVTFKFTEPEELKLEFILDGTRTMEGYFDEYKKLPVSEQLSKFLNTVYNYQGTIHRPNFLLLIWGSEIRFRCVLKNLDINFTLFHPDGTPIRAKITATFLDYVVEEERLAAERKQSPDLTHYQKTTQSDRLDLMTNRIYNNPKYLLQVAKVNSLTTLRTLTPGTELYFPPFNKNEV